MPLVKAVCTNCNGVLEVDNAKDAAICPFCNTPYIVEKAIQQFEIHNTNYIKNAYFINESESEEELINRGIKQLELMAWKDAEETFRQATKKYPANYKSWLGLCIVEASDDNGKSYDLEAIRNSVMRQCPADIKDSLYGAKVMSKKRIKQLTDEIQDCYNRMRVNKDHNRSIKREISEWQTSVVLRNAVAAIVLLVVLLAICFGHLGTRALILWLLVVAYHIYKIVENRKNADVSIKTIKDEKYAYEDENGEYLRLIEDLQCKLEVEQSYKDVQYYIDIMKG